MTVNERIRSEDKFVEGWGHQGAGEDEEMGRDGECQGRRRTTVVRAGGSGRAGKGWCVKRIGIYLDLWKPSEYQKVG